MTTRPSEREGPLLNEEAALADFFDNASIPLHWVGADGKILRANNAELELLGYRAEEYVGHHIAEFHVEPEVIADILRRLSAGEMLHDYPSRLRCKDGSIREVRITSSVNWREGRFVNTRCVTRDVTADEQARRARAEAADFLEGLFEGFVACDTGWRVTHMNAAAERITGRKRADVLGKTLREAFPGSVGNPVEQMYQRAMETRRPERMEHFHEPYGQWLEISASPVKTGGLAFYFRDITELKRRDELQARLAAIVESSEDAIVSKSLDGIIQSWNAGAQRIFGWTAEEAIGKPILLIIPPERHDEERQILARLQRGERVEHFDTVRVTKDGRRIDISVTISPVRDAAARIVGASKVARDIGERKQMLRALEEASRQKDRFLAMLAHELRNPLAPIRNGLQLLRMVDPASEPAGRARAIMERQVDHLVRLVDDLMDVSRITRGRFEMRREPVELASVVLSAVETSRPAIEGGLHHFTLNLPSEPVVVDADFVRLAQVIANLLNNAAKYTDDGGQISLAAQRVGDEAVIRVRDNGIGIDPETMPRLFEMFAQAEDTVGRSRGGLGIGLALARSLVEMQGGRIEAHSAGRGHGSEFVVRLPLARTARTRRPASRSGMPGSEAPRRVLVVDDNVDAARTLEAVLRELGHDVAVAHDGPAALRVAREHPPEVVLLDISMPGMDGIELARRLRAQPGLDAVRFAAVTGLGQEADRRRTREAGFDVHLVKPLSPEDLRRALEFR
jgi:PAS domain S-box-containing protein